MEHIIKKQNNIGPGPLPEELDQIVQVRKLVVRILVGTARTCLS